MKYERYKFKFYLNASHSIYINGTAGEKHPHTWEITISTAKLKSVFVKFNNVEKLIEDYLRKFQDSYLNEIPPFDTTNPTLENISEFLKDRINEILTDNGWILLVVEVSETPARSYVIDLMDENQSILRQETQGKAPETGGAAWAARKAIEGIISSEKKNGRK